ncbi:MAG: M20/M25/M40 family metallo-hydrolase [Gemmatimonadaceae bacterium]
MLNSIRYRAFGALAALIMAPPPTASAQTLARTEERIRDHVIANTEGAITLLERAVNINSGTMNRAGVEAVGMLFAGELQPLGFRTSWLSMAAVNRAGHLVAERPARRRRGRATPLRLLLIGHLDTVFEGEGQQFARADTIATGAGTSDMKGGIVVMVQALKALASVGSLDDMHLIIVLTGDEENAGDPLSMSRDDLIRAAQRSDLVLSFEGGSDSTAVVARRGSSDWILNVTATQYHSSGMFGDSAGYGAIYEAARILTEFRTALEGRQYLTFSPGVILSGEKVSYDTAMMSGTASGKTNIVPPVAVVHGDLRFISKGQLDSTRIAMREIVARSLRGTAAEIIFNDAYYPAMAPTPANYALVAVYDTVSRALGYAPVAGNDPARRGAGDISFVAPIIPGLDGLGVFGRGAHSPRESVDLASLPKQTSRAALLMYRLSRDPAQTRRRLRVGQAN